MNRRNLLKAMPAALAVGAAPAFAAIAVQETPVQRAFDEWKAANADLRDPRWDSISNDEQDARCALVAEMSERILDIPSENPGDFILKVMAYTFMGENGLPAEDENPALWAEARALVA